MSVPAVLASCRELAELVPDHRLGDEDGHVLAAVVYGDRVPHHLGEHVAAPRPGLDDPLLASLIQLLHLAQERLVGKRAFLERTAHLFGPPANDHAVGLLVATCALAQCGLAPRRLRVATGAASALSTAMGVVERVHRHAAHRRPEA